jgi:hypothetical protein
MASLQMFSISSVGFLEQNNLDDAFTGYWQALSQELRHHKNGSVLTQPKTKES